MKTNQISLGGITLEVDYAIIPGEPGSYTEPPVEDDIEVLEVRYQGLDVTPLILAIEEVHSRQDWTDVLRKIREEINSL